MLIKTDFCLKPFNTLGVMVKAEKVAMITSSLDLQELYEENQLKNQTILFLGEGSNILFTNNFRGLVLINQMRGKKIVSETTSHILLKVEGGELWSSLVDYVVDNKWGGLENLSLIPGTVGAAPVQNIGAYGVELKNVLYELEAFDLEKGESVIFKNEDCEFTYRNSIFKSRFKGRYFILNVTFKLDKNPVFNIEYAPLKKAFEGKSNNEIDVKEISDRIKKIRQSKLPEPEELKNAGSFFKNPIVDIAQFEKLKGQFPDIPAYPLGNNKFKLAAAWLIELCGWKGERIGDAGVYQKHALVLVNYGGATGQQIFDLSEKIRQSVKDKFAVDIEREVNVF